MVLVPPDAGRESVRVPRGGARPGERATSAEGRENFRVPRGNVRPVERAARVVLDVREVFACAPTSARELVAEHSSPCVHTRARGGRDD